jgi:hypothetical protein
MLDSIGSAQYEIANLFSHKGLADFTIATFCVEVAIRKQSKPNLQQPGTAETGRIQLKSLGKVNDSAGGQA